MRITVCHAVWLIFCVQVLETTRQRVQEAKEQAEIQIKEVRQQAQQTIDASKAATEEANGARLDAE